MIYEATADYAGTIGGEAILAVDAYEPIDGSDPVHVATKLATAISGHPDEDGWDSLLADHGWRRVGPWTDHGGYRTAAVA